MKQEQILSANVKLNEFLFKKTEAISSTLEQTKYKATSRAMLSYLARGSYVNNAILSCYDTHNAYSIGIIFRSMIEHSFRHLYLYTRAIKEDSDEVGNEYYGKLKGTEDLDSLRKISNYNKKVYPEQTVWNFSGEHNKNIKDVGGKFEISQIFTYVIENFQSDEELIAKGMKDYLKHRLNQYTQLSSYVHGGPYAEMSHEFLLKDRKKVDEHILDITCESFRLYKNMISTTVLFASLFEEKHWADYKEVTSIEIK